MDTTPLPGFSLTIDDLYNQPGKVDAAFLQYLASTGNPLHSQLLQQRANLPENSKDESAFLIELAPHLDDFIAELFGIRSELSALTRLHEALSPLYAAKRLFVQRRAAKAYKAEDVTDYTPESFVDDELAFSSQVLAWMDSEETHASDLDNAAKYAAWALHTPAGRARHGSGILFQVPHKLDMAALIPQAENQPDGWQLPPPLLRDRQGFGLTDMGGTLAEALDEANYCIWCHKQGKDSCRTGLRDRKTGDFQKTPLGITQAGCPLEEKISEMHFLKSHAVPVGALAVAMVDNPMIAGTGHRICNDCMKGCIYQKQEPVNIPKSETRTLRDVLELPWGFEIYSLLSRWNPLNLRRPLPKADSGYKVLVVGMGPAGYTLAHHLLNEGHTVVGIDGLKIEPLPDAALAPIKDITTLWENLGERISSGFGGVAEYGITVRWDKNFLGLLRLLLERREQFRLLGGVRFGGTLTLHDAWNYGFDHVALCMGAGKPTIIDMPGNLAPGVRQASDFLMALQLTGAAREDSLANLQVKLPVVVIGGGLTAIDSATEALAYYPVQVEKFLRQYETLCAENGREAVEARWSMREKRDADIFLRHARALQGQTPERQRTLLREWGGVTVAYRRGLTDAPSYTLNHEEVFLALQEGIRILDNAMPLGVLTDEQGHACGLNIRRHDEEKILAAGTVLVAAGTQPNTVLAREEDGIALDGKYFQAIGLDGAPVTPERVAKPAEANILMHRHADGRLVSFFGDLHPSYAGNVVKAMASAKQGYPLLCSAMTAREPTAQEPDALLETVTQDFSALVQQVNRLTPTIVEVIVKAPAAARRFQPGQFFRLQNYERLAETSGKTLMAMEGLAMTGAWVDPDQGLVSVIALEMGGSSNLCARLKPGEPVVLMGPTGTPTHLSTGETVVLVGGGLGNAVLFSIGKALRAAGNRVLYFAGYKAMQDRFKVADIEAAADVVVWCCDEAPGFVPSRPQDKTFTGNIVQAMGEHGAAIGLENAQRLIVIGSDRMMAAVQQARRGALSGILPEKLDAIGSINSPMQCMMKEICAQCLQRHIDPVTGKETVVFSCFNQDQNLDTVDWQCLNERLQQNTVHEKLSAQWLRRCLSA